MNKKLVAEFQVLGDYNNKIGEVHRARAYREVVRLIKNFPGEITSVSQVKGIPRIGKKSLDKIQEYLTTGKIKAAEEAKKELEKYVVPKTSKEMTLEGFEKIWGVGKVKALELYNQGMRTFADLRKNKHLLTKNQQIGLKYYNDLVRPVTREYIDILRLGIMMILTKEYGKKSFTMEVAGSYRRGANVSGDMDILLTSITFTLKDVVKILTEWGVITEILAMRDEKSMLIAHCPAGNWYFIRLDIEFVPSIEWGSALLYFTGSKTFNQNTRSVAKSQGYLLNQHGLFKRDTGERIPAYTEEEILNFIGLPYTPPEQR